MQSVLRALRILEGVAQHQPVGVGELARHLGLPKSTVQRGLQALEAAEWIAQSNEAKWMLTVRSLTVGQAFARRGGLRESALEPMRWLRDQTEETVNLTIPDGGVSVVVIDRLDSHQAVRTFSRLGDVWPMAATSSGLAILAHLSDTRVDDVLAHAVPKLTRQTVTNPKSIRAELEIVRSSGYAINIGRNRPGVCAIAAAILDPSGAPVASIGVSVPDSRFDERRIKVLGRHVIKAAGDVGRDLVLS
jgi:IclR family acetate operon transcriptional repressor